MSSSYSSSLFFRRTLDLDELGTKSAFTMISEFRTICQIIMKTSFVIPFILSSCSSRLSVQFSLRLFTGTQSIGKRQNNVSSY